MSTALQRRVAQIHSRAKIRAWRYRQRNNADGVWYRLRRLLADSEIVYVLTDEAAGKLLAQGFVSESVGAELQPAKTIISLSQRQAAEVRGKRQIPVALSQELLLAKNLAVVPFKAKRQQ